MLKVSNLSISFGDNYVLKDFDYTFESGSNYALMGANGSGKTTLFNVISGFLSPYAGTIHFQGKLLNEYQPHQIAAMGVSRTFQDLRLFSELTVEENLYVALRNKPTENLLYALISRKQHSTEHQKKVDSILTRIHLLEVRKSKAKNISYGQQKLLTLGMVLINDFNLLLLDEPVAGVQPRYRDEIAKLLSSIKGTVIFIEHNPDFIQQVTNNVIFLDNGSIIAGGDYATLREISHVQEAYL